jgi:hypothetical protein
MSREDVEALDPSAGGVVEIGTIEIPPSEYNALRRVAKSDKIYIES